jgi:uncharacterized protein (DUF58 family)
MAGARATVYLALALFAAGILFDLPPLYVPAIALVALVGGALVWVEAAARGARLRVLPGPPTVEEGAPYLLGLQVDWGRVPPPGGELGHPALERPIAVGPGAPPEVVAELRFDRWGPRKVEPPSLAVRDPLSLHQRSVSGDSGGAVLVLPRVEPLRSPGEGNGGERGLRPGQIGAGTDGRSARPLDPEIDGLRPWQQGSPASRIHWPSVARTGEMLERNLTGGGDSSPLVVLDRADREEPDAVVLAVRAAASLCVHLARIGGCSLLLPGESRLLAVDRELRSWPRVHARLARVDPERPGPAYPPSGASAIFWVSPGGGLAAGTRRTGPDDGWLVTPVAVPDTRALFEVAGCRGYPLASARRALAAARAEAA